MRKQYYLAMLLVNSLRVMAAENSTHWGYDGQEGPANWGKLSPDFSLCETGKNQSPANIHGALKTQDDKLQLNFTPVKQAIVNNGHTVQINVSGGNSMTLYNQTFTMQQFHFHEPGENEINGKQFPMEAHFVYKNSNNDLAVLALMFEEGKANQQLVPAWQQMPTKTDQAVPLSQPVDIKSLLQGRRDFYHFSGSLTTPPCSEGVSWIVLEQPVYASAEQLDKFHSVLHHDNNRPLQPLNGRIIVD